MGRSGFCGSGVIHYQFVMSPDFSTIGRIGCELIISVRLELCSGY